MGRRKRGSACGYAEPRPSKAEARHQRQFAPGAGSHARQPRVGPGVGPGASEEK
jgi:hypothetical protein